MRGRVLAARSCCPVVLPGDVACSSVQGRRRTETAWEPQACSVERVTDLSRAPIHTGVATGCGRGLAGMLSAVPKEGQGRTFIPVGRSQTGANTASGGSQSVFPRDQGGGDFYKDPPRLANSPLPASGASTVVQLGFVGAIRPACSLSRVPMGSLRAFSKVWSRCRWRYSCAIGSARQVPGLRSE